MSKSLKYLIPFGIFIVLAGFLFKGLYMDPRQLPSVLINKPMPQWSLPTLFDTTKTLSTEEMKGKVWMLNVWATWCIPCKQEHPYMVKLKKDGLKTPIVGFVYKDRRRNRPRPELHGRPRRFHALRKRQGAPAPLS